MISFVALSDLNKTHFFNFVEFLSNLHFGCPDKISHDDISAENMNTIERCHKVEHSKSVTNMCESSQVMTFSRDHVRWFLYRSLDTTWQCWQCEDKKFGNMNKLRKHYFRIHSFKCNDLDCLTFSRPGPVVSLPFTQYTFPGSNTPHRFPYDWLYYLQS